jgi:predicted negative regulator of RcsB-dependent stress response
MRKWQRALLWFIVVIVFAIGIMRGYRSYINKSKDVSKENRVNGLPDAKPKN